MRLSDLITLCRKKTSDESKAFYKDVEIARELDLAVKSLWRQKARADESYGRVRFDLSTTDDAEKYEVVDSNEVVWMLPAWVFRVLEVRTRSGTTTLGKLPMRTGDQQHGWSLSGNNELSILGASNAQDLRLIVQKVPARMIRGTVPLDSPGLEKLVVRSTLPVEATETEAFPTDYEQGAMIGARIEITSANATHDPRGVVGTVRAQLRLYDAGLVDYVNHLTVVPRYTQLVKANDTFESHAEIDDADVGLLVLEAVDSMFHKDHNIAGINVIAGALQRERRRFTESLSPRTGDAQFIQTESGDFAPRNPDRDPAFDV